MDVAASKFLQAFALVLILISSSAKSYANSEISPESDFIVYGDIAPRVRGMFYATSTQLSYDEIQKQGHQDLPDLLRSVPGVRVQRSGGLGHQSTFRIRGSESGQVLVLIDGIELNDPATTSSLFSGNLLSLENIHQIDIIKGPQSLAYGPRALGGAILITTRSGQELLDPQRSAEISTTLGSFSSYSIAGNIRTLKDDQSSYALSTHYRQTQGYNITAPDTPESSKEGASLLSTHGHYVQKLGLGKLHSTVHFNYGEVDLDGAGVDLSLPFEKNQGLHLISSYSQEKLFGLSDFLIDVQHSDQERRLVYPEETPFIPQDQNYLFRSQTTKVHGRAKKELSQNTSLSTLVEWSRYQALFQEQINKNRAEQTENSMHTIAGAISLNSYALKNFFYHIGIRYQAHSEYADQFIFGAMSGVEIPRFSSVISLQYATGQNTPSLYQLYSQYGNRDLTPEKTESLELNIEKSHGPIDLGLSLFYQQTKDLIDINSDFTQYLNRQKTYHYGSEVWLNYQGRFSFLNFNLTQQISRDKGSAQRMAYRPSLSGNFQKGFYLLPTLDLSLYGHYQGRRKTGLSFGPAEMPSYMSFDMGANYQKENIFISLKVHNLFDHSYQTINGFLNSGRSAHLKVSYQF